MFKRSLVFICLLTITTTHFAMVFEEDTDNVLLVGTLTHPGERYPIGILPRKDSIKQEAKLAQFKVKKEKPRDSGCLSILNYLLQQYQYAQTNPFISL